MNHIYEKLSARLNDLGSGFPAARSGIEITILKRLFTQEEATFFVKLSPLPETPEEVAVRLDHDPQETAKTLECMAAKGLLLRVREDDKVRYGSVPFVPGIWDFQLNSLTRELAMDMDRYTEEAFGRAIQGHGTPVMRSIPVDRRLVADFPVAPYDDALEILNGQSFIAVAPCICRTKSGMLGKGCGKPMETCFMFGVQGRYYVDNRMGRPIGKEEATDILHKSVSAGLVLQPFNARRTGVMCACCGDCCEMLGSLKKQPVPALAVKSNYFAEVAADDCSGCESCIDRCQMEAIAVADSVAEIDRNRCIGCGLCATTCPTGAVRLKKKAKNEQYLPPESVPETFMSLAVERKKIPCPPK